MTSEEARIFIDQCVEKLGEHFDAVQIMVCWQSDSSTHCIKRGGGLWHARQGMAQEFINEDMAQENAVQISEKLNPPDEGDDWKASTP